MPTVGVPFPMSPSPRSVLLVPIKSFPREPVATDISYPVGQLICIGKDPETGVHGDLWYCAGFDEGLALWRKFSQGGGDVIVKVDADSGEATTVGGVLSIVGDKGVTTSAAGNTVTVSGDGLATINGGSGTATPSSGAITITGSGSVSTTASGSTVTISCSALTAMSFAGDTGTASGTTITLTGGTTGLTFAGATSTITLGGRLSVAQGGRMTWGVVGTSGALVPNTGIVCTTGAALTFTLPTTSAVGDVVAVVLDGSTSWSIVPGTGQTIRYGNGVITSSGSLSSTDQGDYVELVCSVGNTRWVAAPPFGNPLPV